LNTVPSSAVVRALRSERFLIGEFLGDDVSATCACLRGLKELALGNAQKLDGFWRRAKGRPLHLDVYVHLRPRGLRPEIRIPRLLDALVLALPLWARRPARHCGNDRCPEIVIAGAHPRRFCSHRCYNIAHVRAAKRKARALRRLAQGDTVAAVAERYRLDSKDIRKWQRAPKRGRRKRGQ
jgi:hypothetical protein